MCSSGCGTAAFGSRTLFLKTGKGMRRIDPRFHALGELSRLMPVAAGHRVVVQPDDPVVVVITFFNPDKHGQHLHWQSGQGGSAGAQKRRSESCAENPGRATIMEKNPMSELMQLTYRAEDRINLCALTYAGASLLWAAIRRSAAQRQQATARGSAVKGTKFSYLKTPV